jgi:hypothetical protein
MTAQRRCDTAPRHEWNRCGRAYSKGPQEHHQIERVIRVALLATAHKATPVTTAPRQWVVHCA